MAGRRSGAAAAGAAPPAGAGGVMHDDPMDWERTVEYVDAPEVSLPTPMDYVMTGPANAGPEHAVTTTIYPDNAMFGSMGGLVEAVHVAYYEFITSSGPKRILMLGELHETKSLEHQTVDVRVKNPARNSQVVDYLDRLSEALAIDGRCLDVYVEYRFKSPKDRQEVGLVDMRARLNQRGGAHGRSMLRAYLSSGKVRPGIDAAAAAREKRNRRNHRYDMRNLGGAYEKNYCIPNYGCSGSHSDDVMTVDDYIAMYLGIGPQSQGGKPLPAVVAKWNQLRAREATRTTRGKPPADEGYMNMLRRRYRKAFSDFQRATTQGQNMAHMLFAIRLAVLQGSRGLLSTYLVPADKIGETFVNGWSPRCSPTSPGSSACSGRSTPASTRPTARARARASRTTSSGCRTSGTR